MSLTNTDKRETLCLMLHLNGFAYKEKYQRSKTNLETLAKILLQNQFNPELEKSTEVKKAHTEKNIQIITFFDENYPELLRHIPDPPFILFCLGNISLINNRKVSIVGTRKPDILSMKSAHFISSSFSQKGISVVSGMAHGIDTACHRASYNSSGGTIGVVAHGLDYIYPQSNYDLFQLAKQHTASGQKNLLFISEYPMGIKPKRYHFPKRNRIISGLSKSLMFIQGGSKSGALISCRYALDQGREVYVLDHPLFSNNEGGRKLLSEGAIKLASYLNIDVQEGLPNQGLLKSLKSKSSFYLGNNLWVNFKTKAENYPPELAF